MLNKRGFTIIELGLVILVLGVLMLIARPNFTRNVEKTKITNIVYDIRVAENKVEELMTIDQMPDNWVSLDSLNLNQAIQEGQVYELTGVADDVIQSDYQVLNENVTKSKLKGVFLANQDGKVYYIRK